MGFCSNPAISEGTTQSMVCSRVLALHFEHILKSSLILNIVPVQAGALQCAGKRAPKMDLRLFLRFVSKTTRRSAGGTTSPGLMLILLEDSANTLTDGRSRHARLHFLR